MKAIHLAVTSFLWIVLAVFIPAGASFAQSDLPDRVPQLQEIARKANGGALGCGEGGTVIMLTSRGEITAAVNLDTFHVFREKIVIADLLKLLEARSESNATGRRYPMSGEVDDLIYIILSALEASKDPAAIPVIGRLLADKNERIVILSFFALINLGNSEEDLQRKVEKVDIPESALEIFKVNGVNLPDWAKNR